MGCSTLDEPQVSKKPQSRLNISSYRTILQNPGLCSEMTFLNVQCQCFFIYGMTISMHGNYSMFRQLKVLS